MGDCSRGDWATIDDFEVSRGLEGEEGEVVVAGECFVYEGDASGSTVNQGSGTDEFVTKEDSARDNKVLPFIQRFLQHDIRNRQS
jgi:hypothetical protein